MLETIIVPARPAGDFPAWVLALPGDERDLVIALARRNLSYMCSVYAAETLQYRRLLVKIACEEFFA